MAKKRFSVDQIVTLLRQIEVPMTQGKPPVGGPCSATLRSLKSRSEPVRPPSPRRPATTRSALRHGESAQGFGLTDT